MKRAISSTRPISRKTANGAIFSLVLVLFVGFLMTYSILAFWLLHKIHSHESPTESVLSKMQELQSGQVDLIQRENRTGIQLQTNPNKVLFGVPMNDNYFSWLNVTLRLTALSPSDLLSALDQQDPFAVRAFDSALIQQELLLQRTLRPDELAQLFPCPPPGQRLTLPIQVNHTKSRLFRQNLLSPHTNNGYFLFFQHLRKAGGTHFCSLAQNNMPKKLVPDYFCMPDWDWSHYKTAGYLHSYTNEQLVAFQQDQGWRIAGNEWEPFRSKTDSHFHLPAVFATSFRKPLHRALSQFRFECIENRGCFIKNVTRWWEVERHLKNVYLSTFADLTHLLGFYSTCHDMTPEAIHQRQEYVQHAMNVLSQYHLVLVMEWLAYAQPLLQNVLGFQNTKGVVQRVRPHIVQAQRDGGKQNHLGAAGIKTDGSSWEPEEYLDAYTYQTMSQDLALDSLLTDVARRMFLERTICGDTNE